MVRHEPVRRRAVASVAGLVVGSVFCLLAGGGSASAAPKGPTAQAARTVDVNQSASLRLVRKSGSVLYERGKATGTLPGAVTARFVVSSLRVTGEVTFLPRGGGSITFAVEGFPRSTGTRARFAGTMSIVRGSGRYAKARGGAAFNGVVNRRSWAVSVSATGRMRY